jgi:hypothetical protein
MITHS